MHILLTDILACPVCGPPFGLIVRSDSMRDRRVVEGALGCANCERQFAITSGVAHLDPEKMEAQGGPRMVPPDADHEVAIRMAALLGLDDAGGFALLAGPAAVHAAEVSALAGTSEILADVRYADAGALSRLQLGARLPFYDAKLGGVWLSGDTADAWLEEAARVLHPLARLVLEPAPATHAARLADAGLKIVAQEGDTVLAMRA